MSHVYNMIGAVLKTGAVLPYRRDWSDFTFATYPAFDFRVTAVCPQQVA